MKPLAQNLGLCKLCWRNLEHNRQTEYAGILGLGKGPDKPDIPGQLVNSHWQETCI